MASAKRPSATASRHRRPEPLRAGYIRGRRCDREEIVCPDSIVRLAELLIRGSLTSQRRSASTAPPRPATITSSRKGCPECRAVSLPDDRQSRATSDSGQSGLTAQPTDWLLLSPGRVRLEPSLDSRNSFMRRDSTRCCGVPNCSSATIHDSSGDDCASSSSHPARRRAA